MIGFAAPPARADCIYDIAKAREVVGSMTQSHAKEMAERELKLAEEALRAGDEELCLVHVGMCVNHARSIAK
jgi:HEPN domain-containing protein